MLGMVGADANTLCTINTQLIPDGCLAVMNPDGLGGAVLDTVGTSLAPNSSLSNTECFFTPFTPIPWRSRKLEIDYGGKRRALTLFGLDRKMIGIVFDVV